MSNPHTRTARYDPSRHDVSRFAYGNELLDRWLVRYAGQSDRRDGARTFVDASEDGAVAGYYTLVAGEIGHDEATDQVRKGLSSQFPIPVVILARLAVHQQQQRQGLGAQLLTDAFERIVRAAEEVAVRAVVVHAIDDEAASFYQRFGFNPVSGTPRTLMVTLAELRAAGYER